MSKAILKNQRIAILATDGFEESELFSPLDALRKREADVKIVSLDDGKIHAWTKDHWGKKLEVDLKVADADAAEFDALVIPGGVMNPDRLRMDKKAVAFVRAFAEAGKPIAAICHGPWMLVEAGVADGRTLTSYASIRTDLVNAGAHWVDERVVVDHGIVTSRKPDDLAAFCEKMIEAFAAGPVQPVAKPTVRNHLSAAPKM